MESLARWLKREENPMGRVLVGFSGAAGLVFLFALVVAAWQSTTPTPPPGAAWFLIGALLIATIGFGMAALKAPRRRAGQPSLASLHSAAFYGKLSEALGTHAEVLAAAATNLEQTSALLGHSQIDAAFSKSLVEAANERLRRMLNLVVTVPGEFGLTYDQAEELIAKDARWLEQVRSLVESTHAKADLGGDDGMLSALHSLVKEREEAVLELRA